MGRAGRPQFDDQGVAVIYVHDVKKHFYKKFLYEPFPVESRFVPKKLRFSRSFSPSDKHHPCLWQFATSAARPYQRRDRRGNDIKQAGGYGLHHVDVLLPPTHPQPYVSATFLSQSQPVSSHRQSAYLLSVNSLYQRFNALHNFFPILSYDFNSIFVWIGHDRWWYVVHVYTDECCPGGACSGPGHPVCGLGSNPSTGSNYLAPTRF